MERYKYNLKTIKEYFFPSFLAFLLFHIGVGRVGVFGDALRWLNPIRRRTQRLERNSLR